MRKCESVLKKNWRRSMSAWTCVAWHGQVANKRALRHIVTSLNRRLLKMEAAAAAAHLLTRRGTLTMIRRALPGGISPSSNAMQASWSSTHLVDQARHAGHDEQELLRRRQLRKGTAVHLEGFGLVHGRSNLHI